MNHTIELTTGEAEAIGLPPGYTIRPPTWEDLPAAVALLRAEQARAEGAPSATETNLRHDWEDPELTMERDVRLVHDPDGALVGYYAYYRSGQGNHPWFDSYTHPDAEGRGIGTAGLHWTVRRAMEVAESLPADQRVSAFAGTLRDYEPGNALLAGFGMTAVRYFWRMVIELEGLEIPAPEWPEGIELRPFERERDALALYRAMAEAFADHWGHDPVQSEEEDFERWSHWAFAPESFDPDLVFVAWAGDEIAGFSRCRPYHDEDPDMGWLSQLAVRRPWRKHGLATALLYHTFAAFQQRGKARVGLGVDGANPTGATRLYERVGMRVVREYVNYEMELRPGRETAAL